MSLVPALEYELESCIRNRKPRERIEHVREQLNKARAAEASTQRAATVADRGQAPRGRRSATKDKG